MNLTDLTPDSVIFDLDGTLWDATYITEAAWKIILAAHPDVEPVIPLSLENIRGHMGMTNEELGAVFFPFLSPEDQMKMMRECCYHENKNLGEKGGVLFPAVMETLQRLSEKIPLFIVSNCQCGYIECFLGANGGAPYIRDFECSDNTGMEKGDNIRLIMERNGLKKSVYVGDTNGDSSAAEKAGVPFIYAKYGFGERYGRGRVTDYTYAVDTFAELTALIQTDERKDI